MKRALKNVFDYLREFDYWGLRLPTAAAAPGPRLDVYLVRVEGTRQRIGTLMQEHSEFVFRYDSKFSAAADARPIAAFPDLGEEYRSRELWPFFSVRIPPVDREDVRAAMERLKIGADDTLRLLGKLSQRTVTTPYRFDLVEAA